MSREIKFRVWLDDDKKMFNNAGVVGKVVVLEHNGEGYIDDNTDFEPLYWGSVDDSTIHVMQYTGLKDKNGKGKEIYNGDIILYEDSSGKKHHLVVKWNELGACYDFGWVRTDYAVRGEVIGNIYENPELLNS